MSKEKKVLEYKGILCDSSEEIALLQWLWELKNLGYIRLIDRCYSFKLSDAVKLDYKESKQLKTKSKEVIKQLDVLREHVYTPEFTVQWCDNFILKAAETPNGIFYTKDLDYLSLITYFEVKPKFDQNNMSRLFKINQKWMWDKHGIFVNLVIPEKLFKETFTPKEYLLTPTGKSKKINWKIRTCNEFLKSFKQ